MDTQKLIKEAHGNAINKAFYECKECEGNGITGATFEGTTDCKLCLGTGIDQDRNIEELLMLIVIKLSKSIEAHRKNNTIEQLKIDQAGWFSGYQEGDVFDKNISDYNNGDNKIYWGVFEETFKNTFEFKIADTFIRLFDLCGYMGIARLNYCEDHGVGIEKNIPSSIYCIIRTLPSIKSNSETAKNNFNTFYSVLYDFCKLKNIDIEKYITVKMIYNKQRKYKHGKGY